MTVDAVSALDLSYTPLLGSPWTRSSPGHRRRPEEDFVVGGHQGCSASTRRTLRSRPAPPVSMDLHSAWPPYGTDEDT